MPVAAGRTCGSPKTGSSSGWLNETKCDTRLADGEHLHRMGVVAADGWTEKHVLACFSVH
jgi:hypothetical protein